MSRPISERINRNVQALLGILPPYEPRMEVTPIVVPVIDVTDSSVWERAQQKSVAAIDLNTVGTTLATVPSGVNWAILALTLQVVTAQTGGVSRISFYMIPRGIPNRVSLRDTVQLGDAVNSMLSYQPLRTLVLEAGSVIGFDNLVATTTGVGQLLIHYLPIAP